MFGLGGSEILLIIIAIVVLLAMGKLPDVARKAGGAYKTYRDVRRDVDNLTDPSKIIDVLVEDEQPKKKDDDPA